MEAEVTLFKGDTEKLPPVLHKIMYSSDPLSSLEASMPNNMYLARVYSWARPPAYIRHGRNDSKETLRKSKVKK